MFQTLFAGARAGTTINIRVGCSYSYEISAGSPPLTTVVPLFLVVNYGFNTTTDGDPNSATSFVSQTAAAIVAWQAASNPLVANSAYIFDLTVFTSAVNNPLPVIHATNLQYAVTS
jgi:hypothetical protein